MHVEVKNLFYKKKTFKHDFSAGKSGGAPEGKGQGTKDQLSLKKYWTFLVGFFR